MIPSELLDDVTANSLDANWLFAWLAPQCAYGERDLRMRRYFRTGEEGEAMAQAARIANIASACAPDRIDAVRRALCALPDIATAVARVNVGDSLDDPQALELLRFCDGAAEIATLLTGVGALPNCESAALDELRRYLGRGRVGSYAFYLDDAFDDALGHARKTFDEARARFESSRGRLESAVAKVLGAAALSEDEFIVMREGLVGALPPGIHVVREAPTYYLCELELDEEARGHLSRREEAARQVCVVEEHVRAELASHVRSCSDELMRVAADLGEVDLLLAAARWCRIFQCSVPDLASGASFDVEDARWLPLQERLESQGSTICPLTLKWSGAAVLTGPNMGGKSVALRTLGSVALCAMMGLPVPAARARFALPPRILWLGIGSEEEAQGGLLSSFAREVLRVRDAFAALAAGTLLLVDELGRTTTPHEGFALLVALMKTATTRGAQLFCATHLAGVARAAGARHFAVRGLRGIPVRPTTGDLDAALAALAASMDYRIDEVATDEIRHSDALELAHLLGLDPDVIALARAHLLGDE